MQISVLLLLTAIQLHSTLLTQGTVIEGPSDVTYLPGLTPLPIELTCNVTGNALWRVNGSFYTLASLKNGDLPGHNRTETNILVNSPVNNTEYICVSSTNDGDTSSDPAYIIIASVPAMVPDDTVDVNTISINGSIVTLTLSWGEPFNNLDPIVNYTVSCSGDVTCPPDFTTTDNTTRSYTITNLTTMTTYTFSVVATNSIGSGEAAVVMITTPVIDQVTGVMLTCGPMDQINQCIVTWNSVTRGDVTGYLVYYNGTTRNVNSSTTTLTFTAPSLPDGVPNGTVVVMVIAVGESGVGPASDPVTAVITASSVNNTAVTLISPTVTKLYNITVTCTTVNIHPNSTADSCEVMATADGKVTRTGTSPVTNGIANVTVSGLECGVIYTIIAGGTLNGDLVGPRSSFGTVNQLCPSVGTLDSESDSDTPIIMIIVIVVIIVVGGGGGGGVIIVIIIYRKKNGKSRSDKQKLAKSNKVSSKKDTEAEQAVQGVSYEQVGSDPQESKQMEEGITYAHLDHQEGGRPGKFEGGLHDVDYAQVAETQQ